MPETDRNEIQMTRTPASQTVSQRMDAQAALVSNFNPRNAREIADEWANEIVDKARRGESVGHYGEYNHKAVRYGLAVGGPGCDITFVFDADGEIDYAVIDYHEGGPRAFRVIADADAEALYEAMRDADN